VPQTAGNTKCFKINCAGIKCPWLEAFPVTNRKLFEHHRDMKRIEGTPKTLGNNAARREVLETLDAFKVNI
jgi:hypothetical protein